MRLGNIPDHAAKSKTHVKIVTVFTDNIQPTRNNKKGVHKK